MLHKFYPTKDLSLTLCLTDHSLTLTARIIFCCCCGLLSASTEAESSFLTALPAWAPFTAEKPLFAFFKEKACSSLFTITSYSWPNASYQTALP